MDQTVKILNKKIKLRQGESIHTENSYKYSVNSFKSLAESSGFKIKKVMTDQKAFFGIFVLKVKVSFSFLSSFSSIWAVAKVG